MEDKSLGTTDKQTPRVDGTAAMFIGVVVADWHKSITEALLKGCREKLIFLGVDQNNILVQHVPGSFEIPLAAQQMITNTEVDAVVCLGCVIKGDTDHNDHINRAVSQAIMDLNLKHNKPFLYGVLTCDNMDQAAARAGGKVGNKGEDAALAAVLMVSIS